MKHTDPVTGDTISTSEYATIVLQSIIRRWLFLVAFILVTSGLFVWDNPKALFWWNLGASCLAIVVEATIGMAQFSQTKRDAAIIREMRKLAKSDEKHSRLDYEVDLDSNSILQRIERILTEAFPELADEVRDEPTNHWDDHED